MRPSLCHEDFVDRDDHAGQTRLARARVVFGPQPSACSNVPAGCSPRRAIPALT